MNDVEILCWTTELLPIRRCARVFTIKDSVLNSYLSIGVISRELNFQVNEPTTMLAYGSLGSRLDIILTLFGLTDLRNLSLLDNGRIHAQDVAGVPLLTRNGTEAVIPTTNSSIETIGIRGQVSSRTK